MPTSKGTQKNVGFYMPLPGPQRPWQDFEYGLCLGIAKDGMWA